SSARPGPVRIVHGSRFGPGVVSTRRRTLAVEGSVAQKTHGDRQSRRAPVGGRAVVLSADPRSSAKKCREEHVDGAGAAGVRARRTPLTGRGRGGKKQRWRGGFPPALEPGVPTHFPNGSG
ncbi:unnamed protein product, partial [Ixodes pacificus]